MTKDQIIFGVVFILLLCIFMNWNNNGSSTKKCSDSRNSNSKNSNSKNSNSRNSQESEFFELEHMAPISSNTFKNTKSTYGSCSQKEPKESACTVGNCPLGSTISDSRYCEIQCALEPDPKIRAGCRKHCMNMMKSGCR